MDTRALVALQVPPGPALLGALAGARDGGPAVLPLSPALPPAELTRVLAALRPARLIRPDGVIALPDPAPVPADVAVVVGTSGSTGTPKGVALTWAALEASARASLDRVGAWEGLWLCCLPLSSVGGLQVVVRAWLAGTDPVVQPRFDVATVARADAAHVSVVPTMLGRLLDAGVDLGRFATVLLGGAPATPALLERARAARAPVVTTYGMTETAGGCVYDGRPLDGVEAAVGADGRIRLRGPVLARGYVTAAGLVPLPLEAASGRAAGPAGQAAEGGTAATTGAGAGPAAEGGVPRPAGAGAGPAVEGKAAAAGGAVAGPAPEATAGSAAGAGWFVTDDLGRLAGDGRLEVLGRADDVIVTGGQKVAAGRVAALVAGHPGVAEAAAVGRPDPEWGERVVAVVVPRGTAPDLAALRAFLRDRAAPHELPRELVVTDALPLLPNGKLDRLALRVLDPPR